MLLRRLILILCLAGFSSIYAAASEKPFPSLIGDVWAVCGIDRIGTWHETTLVFTQQTIEGDELVLEGYFDWKGSNGSYGREFFDGRVHSSGVIRLVGHTLENSYRIVNSRYAARLTGDGQSLIDGKWFDGIPGNWGALRGANAEEVAALCEAQTA
ncbi:MAG: hypothetical protein AAF557_05195 [Pseudomonadota bacterium]